MGMPNKIPQCIIKIFILSTYKSIVQPVRIVCNLAYLPFKAFSVGSKMLQMVTVS